MTDMTGTFIYVATLLALSIASWKKPAVVIGGVLCMFAIEQYGQSVNPFFVQYSAVTNIFLALISVVALIQKIRGSKFHQISYGQIGWFVIALYFYALMSALWAPQPDFSIDNYMRSAPYIVLFILVAPLVAVSEKDLVIALKAIVIIGSFFSLLLLFFVDWSGRGVVVAGVHDKYGNLLAANPLESAKMAGYAALAAVLYSYGKKGSMWGWLKWPIVILSIVLAIKTGSRGQAFFLLIVLIMFWPLRNKLSINAFLSVVAPAVIGVFTFQIAIDFFWADSERWSSGTISSDLSGRTSMAASLLGSWWNSSILSLFFGLGSSASFDPDVAGYYPHIVPLEIMGEGGVLGFGIFLTIVVKTSMSFFRVINLNNQKYRGLIVVLGSMFTYTFLLSLKQGSLIGSPEMFLFAILIGKYEKIALLSDRRDRYIKKKYGQRIIKNRLS